MAPSLRPSVDFCTSSSQDKFEMLLTPDSTNPGDIYFNVWRKVDSAFTRRVFANWKYSTDDADQSSIKCLPINYCYKAIVYSRAGVGIGTGSFQAYFHGKTYLKNLRLKFNALHLTTLIPIFLHLFF